MLGYKFLIENEWGRYLEKIFKKIENDNYIWKIDEEEILTENNDDFFDKYELSSKEFQKRISEGKYYTIFANIKIYNKVIDKEVITFDEFKNSNCILVLIIVDNEYVEVFSKDFKLLSQIKANIIENNFKITKELNEENNTRKKLSISEL